MVMLRRFKKQMERLALNVLYGVPEQIESFLIFLRMVDNFHWHCKKSSSICNNLNILCVSSPFSVFVKSTLPQLGNPSFKHHSIGFVIMSVLSFIVFNVHCCIVSHFFTFCAAIFFSITNQHDDDDDVQQCSYLCDAKQL